MPEPVRCYRKTKPLGGTRREECPGRLRPVYTRTDGGRSWRSIGMVCPMCDHFTPKTAGVGSLLRAD